MCLAGTRGHGACVSSSSYLPVPPWAPCFLDVEQYSPGFIAPPDLLHTQVEPAFLWTEELCPFCQFSHLTSYCWRIVTTWLRLQPDLVREIAESLGHGWTGTWYELQVAAVRLAES